MNKTTLCAALLAALVCAAVGPAARADDGKHDSNTLHKVGKAIAYPVKKAAGNASKTANKTGQAVQYPVRKAGENASITTHRALGHNSVVHRRPQHAKAVVTPNGKLHPLPPK
jgi:hypothetical protein